MARRQVDLHVPLGMHARAESVSDSSESAFAQFVSLSTSAFGGCAAQPLKGDEMSAPPACVFADNVDSKSAGSLFLWTKDLQTYSLSFRHSPVSAGGEPTRAARGPRTGGLTARPAQLCSPASARWCRRRAVA
jgi:hypothetical protein